MCREWGLDPGAVFSDDFLAWQMRVGLAIRVWDEQGKERPDASEARHHRAIADIDKGLKWQGSSARR